MGTKKPYRIATSKDVKKARKKLIILLGWELARYKILETVMKEFITRGLDKTYAKEIEAWKKYIREQKFSKKLDKQMRDEIERFQKTIKKWKPKELEEFIIEGLDCLE